MEILMKNGTLNFLVGCVGVAGTVYVLALAAQKLAQNPPLHGASKQAGNSLFIRNSTKGVAM
jgi:hypothetical protein